MSVQIMEYNTGGAGLWMQRKQGKTSGVKFSLKLANLQTRIRDRDLWEQGLGCES